MPSAGAISPINANQRIGWIDAIRGFALLGILVANIYGFALPSSPAERPDQWDKLADLFAAYFVRGKFLILFAVLFGISLALQHDRCLRRGADASKIFRRRQVGLLIIGMLHAAFLSWQDILVFYSLLGLATWPFRNRTPKTLLIWAITLYAASFVPSQIERLHDFYWHDNESVAVTAQGQASQEDRTRIAEAVAPPAENRWVGWNRVSLFLDGNPATSYEEYLRKLPFFLFGLFLVRSGLLASLTRSRSVALKSMIVAGVVGITSSAFLFLAHWHSAPDWAELAQLPLVAIANPSMSFFYALCIVYLASRPTTWKVVEPLSQAGRAALSNYIIQSALCAILFSAHGFGLFGVLGAFQLTIVAAAIFSAQVGLSRLWLTKYRFGPLEWVWRSNTYWALQPMRKCQAN